jgi:DEP domain-containing protein 5
MSCQHDVTMTLFSRVFYDAKSIDDFPASLRDDINQDHRNRFYEDFYRYVTETDRLVLNISTHN